MTKIIVFCGKRQSGKNTCANIVHGLIMKKFDFIENFVVDDDGDLLVNTIDQNNKSGMGVLNLTSAYYNPAVADYLYYSGIWNKIKLYHFADELKFSIHKIFNVPLNILYGTDKDKMLPTDINWGDIFKFLHPKKIKQVKEEGKELDSKMTVRELLQYFGTEICRGLYDNCWIDSCLRRIQQDAPEVAVIADCRFPNEATRAKEYGGQIIRLKRNLYQSSHSSELALDEYNDYDAVIDNQNYSIHQTGVELNKILNDWNVV